MTERYQPQIPYEQDDLGELKPEVKWARVAALVVALSVTFLLGRASAPDLVATERVDGVRAEIEDAEREIEALEEALRTQPQPTASLPATPQPEATPTLGSGRVYVVQSGDTLRGIAQTFCGDADLDDFIASFNEIEDPSSIPVGMELRIPTDCDR